VIIFHVISPLVYVYKLNKCSLSIYNDIIFLRKYQAEIQFILFIGILFIILLLFWYNNKIGSE